MLSAVVHKLTLHSLISWPAYLMSSQSCCKTSFNTTTQASISSICSLYCVYMHVPILCAARRVGLGVTVIQFISRRLKVHFKNMYVVPQKMALPLEWSFSSPFGIPFPPPAPVSPSRACLSPLVPSASCGLFHCTSVALALSYPGWNGKVSQPWAWTKYSNYEITECNFTG